MKIPLFYLFVACLTSGCRLKIAFCVDSSSSIKDEVYKKEKNFVSQLYDNVSREAKNFVEAAAWIFALNSEQIFKYSDYRKARVIKRKLINMPKITGSASYGTYTNRCMKSVYEYNQSLHEQNTNFVVIVVTDGKNTTYQMGDSTIKKMAKDMTDAEYAIYAIGFNGATLNDLKKITNGNEKNALFKKDLNQLSEHINTLFDEICENFNKCSEPPTTSGNIEDVSMCSNIVNGNTCDFVCKNDDYVKSPNPICNGTEWSSKATCEIKKCRKNPEIQFPDTIKNELYCKETNTGGECAFECENGDYVKSPNPICNGTEWSSPATCEIKKCLDNPKVAEGTKVEEMKCKDTEIRGECNFVCIGFNTTEDTKPKCVGTTWDRDVVCKTKVPIWAIVAGALGGAIILGAGIFGVYSYFQTINTNTQTIDKLEPSKNFKEEDIQHIDPEIQLL